MWLRRLDGPLYLCVLSVAANIKYKRQYKDTVHHKNAIDQLRTMPELRSTPALCGS
jgi:hypothetical protein